ncbi:MAG TPA: patatin-like phospholipase family protein [Polyangiaceae bacterium]|nr:patatin-like phospholipase family protein [Polyangiaceae bacterium]
MPRALPRTLGEWLEAPFALAMSSGFFSFFAHTGVLGALVATGAAPTRVSGSSAGALVTGAYAAGADPEHLEEELARLRRQDFWDPRPGLGLLAGRLFHERLTALLPARTFEACRIPAAVSVYDVRSRSTRVLRSGDLPLAIRASCTVPFLFHPAWQGRRPLLDGGILDRPGLLGMPAGERLLFHHIVSRSPWRRAGDAGMQVPTRDNMVTLRIHGLPRSGPFRLDEGRRAVVAARRAAVRALALPIGPDGIVDVEA